MDPSEHELGWLIGCKKHEHHTEHTYTRDSSRVVIFSSMIEISLMYHKSLTISNKIYRSNLLAGILPAPLRCPPPRGSFAAVCAEVVHTPYGKCLMPQGVCREEILRQGALPLPAPGKNVFRKLAEQSLCSPIISPSLCIRSTSIGFPKFSIIREILYPCRKLSRNTEKNERSGGP